MSALTFIKQAADCSVRVSLNGDSLALRAATKPSASLLAKLKQHKAEIVALLRQEECSARPLEPDEAELEERAAGSNAKSRRVSRMAIGGKPSMTLAGS